MVASGIQFSWAIGLRPQVLTRTCWQEAPSVLCHVDLSIEVPSTWQLASPERADKRAGRDEETQKRPVSRNAREEKGSRKREQTDEHLKVCSLDGTLKQLLCNGGQLK